MKVTITRLVDAPRSAVWRLITDPARMNEWSLAAIALDDPGEGGRPDGVGALRSATVRSGPMRSVLREVVEVSEPPSRMVYRVIGGVPLRHHRGEITLTSEGAATRLAWEVEMTFPVPGIEAVTRASVVPQLEESVTRLASVARGAAEVEVAPYVAFEDDTGTLDAEAEAICEDQRALAARLEAAGDPRHWFARVYSLVTRCQLDAARSGSVTHRAWVLRLIPVFHRYYVDNLRRFVGELDGACEAHWVIAFQRAVPRRGERLLTTLRESFRDAVRAHIEGDLARALAEVHARFYAGRCELVRFRADYLLMTPTFREASERFIDALPRAYVPIEMRLARRWAPAEAVDLVTTRTFYDYIGARAAAFERALVLVGERSAR